LPKKLLEKDILLYSDSIQRSSIYYLCLQVIPKYITKDANKFLPLCIERTIAISLSRSTHDKTSTSQLQTMIHVSSQA